MDKSAYDQMRLVEDEHWWFHARRDILEHVIETKISTSINLKILEIGCGSGGNMKMLTRFGEVTGMEVNAQAAQAAKDRGHLEIIQGRVPDDLPGDKYDLVAMLDVLEHIEHDGIALQAIQKTLSESGNLLITVPAYKFLWTHHDVAMHHYRRYTKTYLQRVLETNGYTIHYISYFNTILFPLVAAIRFLKIARKSTSSDMTMPTSYINTMLYKIFRIETAMLSASSLPFGVSIIAIASVKP